MFLKIGHRGARAYAVENTIESYRKALEIGANAIELDVRMSRDKKLIISHDNNLKRVYGEDVRINEVTLKELKKMTEERIITLEEALHYIDRKVEKILVEIKEAGLEETVISAIRKEHLTGTVIVISFHEDALCNVRELDKKIEIGLVYAKFKKPIDVVLKLNAQYLIPFYRFVHTKDIKKAHKNDLKVIVWTINTKKEARRYIAKGVDGIATDRPDIFEGIA